MYVEPGQTDTDCTEVQAGVATLVAKINHFCFQQDKDLDTVCCNNFTSIDNTSYTETDEGQDR